MTRRTRSAEKLSTSRVAGFGHLLQNLEVDLLNARMRLPLSI